MGFLKKINALKIIFSLLFSFNGLTFADYYKSNVVASYYAEAFHGKKTSNGEIFNMYSLTCAHKQLPFNTVVRVTNISNGKTVDVRVNDRGPFVGTREMDLSKAAAVKLGMIKSGTARVNIQILSLGPNNKVSIQTAQKACKAAKIAYNPVFTNSIKSSSEKTTVTQPSSQNKTEGKTAVTAAVSYDKNLLYDIQMGSFSNKNNANNLAQKLLKDGFKDVVFQSTDTAVRVVLRKVSGADVEKVSKELKNKGYSGFIVKKRVA